MLSSTPRRSGCCYIYWDSDLKAYHLYYGDAPQTSDQITQFEDDNMNLEYTGHTDSFNMTPFQNGECTVIFDMVYVNKEIARCWFTINYFDISIIDIESLIDKCIIGVTSNGKYCIGLDLIDCDLPFSFFASSIRKQLVQLGDLI